MAKRPRTKCFDCGNTEAFVAEYMLQGECVVNADGVELKGIDSPAMGKHAEHCDTGTDLTIQDAYKCAVCGSRNVKRLQNRKYNEVIYAGGISIEEPI